MALDTALGTAHALASDAPEQPLALIAVGGRGGGPHLKVVWRGAGDGVYESLEGLLVDVDLLQGARERRGAGVLSRTSGRIRLRREFTKTRNQPVLRCVGCWTSEPT